MTEAEWLACGDPKRMLLILNQGVSFIARFATRLGNFIDSWKAGGACEWKVSGRKMGFLNCACGRRMWESLDDANRNYIIGLERYVDDGITDDDLAEIHHHIERHFTVMRSFGDDQYATGVHYGDYLIYRERLDRGNPIEMLAQAALVRDIFGNPFRPVTLDPAWRSTNVVGLAQTIYDDRAFDRMPILADALEDAGCSNAGAIVKCCG